MDASKGDNSPRDYIRQSFVKVLDEYRVDCADSTRFTLTYSNPANKKQCMSVDLRQIEVKAGYWLCYYDGHTGDWSLCGMRVSQRLRRL
jgi:hypothetical protein